LTLFQANFFHYWGVAKILYIAILTVSIMIGWRIKLYLSHTLFKCGSLPAGVPYRVKDELQAWTTRQKRKLDELDKETEEIARWLEYHRQQKEKD